MQANDNPGNGGSDSNHGMGDRHDGGQPDSFLVRWNEAPHCGLISRAGIETAIRIAQEKSRDHLFCEVLDENGYIVALFVWGHQVAVNRFWRDSLAEAAPQAPEGK